MYARIVTWFCSRGSISLELGFSVQLARVKFGLYRTVRFGWRLGGKTRTGATFILTTSWVYALSYKQLPSRLPKFLRARFRPSVTASFLHC